MLMRIKRKDAGVVALIAQSLNVEIDVVQVGEDTVHLLLGGDVVLNDIFVSECRKDGLEVY